MGERHPLAPRSSYQIKLENVLIAEIATGMGEGFARVSSLSVVVAV
jgi:hypothetical protein